MKLWLLLIIFMVSGVFTLDCRNIRCSDFEFQVNRKCYWRTKKQIEIINQCCPYSSGYEELAINTCGNTCCCFFSDNEREKNINRNICKNTNNINCIITFRK